MQPATLKQIAIGFAFLMFGFSLVHAANWLFQAYPASYWMVILVGMVAISIAAYLEIDAIKDFLSPAQAPQPQQEEDY